MPASKPHPKRWGFVASGLKDAAKGQALLTAWSSPPSDLSRSRKSVPPRTTGEDPRPPNRSSGLHAPHACATLEMPPGRGEALTRRGVSQNPHLSPT